ncbi:hypothetical protein TNCV_1375491 [Trichonephila clavipes]|nr:hypothetical protein TNCV_1375491 [Trichonephila clavipes]
MIFLQDDDQAHELPPPFSEDGRQKSQMADLFIVRHEHRSYLQRNDDTISDEAHFWLNGYVNKQNCRIWSEANPQVYVETPLHPGKLTVWSALWAGGILLQKR